MHVSPMSRAQVDQADLFSNACREEQLARVAGAARGTVPIPAVAPPYPRAPAGLLVHIQCVFT